MSQYIVIPQRRGKSQRITIPMDLLKSMNWLSVDCYMIEENGEGEMVIKSYSEHLRQHCEHPQPQLWE